LRSARALACLAMLLLAARCSDRQDAIAADVPKLEIRGSVGEAQTATAVASIDGRIAAINVQEGAVVQPGTVIATLRNATVERDLAYAKAQTAVAEERLRAARRGIVRTVVSGEAKAREEAAAEILENREAKRNRYRELFKTRDVSKEELENAENEYAAALRDLLAERDRAQVELPRTDTGLLQLELEKARTELALIDDRRSMLNVTAPIGGTVTRVHARAGDNVFVRDPIVEIANNATAVVRGQIAPELMPHVRPGMLMEVKVFTVPPRRFTAPVRAVVPGTGGAVIAFELPNPDGVLQAGQQALITVK
jgi:multidrug resistance efflux pump